MCRRCILCVCMSTLLTSLPWLVACSHASGDAWFWRCACRRGGHVRRGTAVAAGQGTRCGVSSWPMLLFPPLSNLVCCCCCCCASGRRVGRDGSRWVLRREGGGGQVRPRSAPVLSFSSMFSFPRLSVANLFTPVDVRAGAGRCVCSRFFCCLFFSFFLNVVTYEKVERHEGGWLVWRRTPPH